jgi:hypothetical protein
METQFYILLTLKTSGGLESFARFFIGNNRNRAYDIFEALQGTTEVNEQHVLFIDFMETVDGLPMNLKMIGCTLSQLAESCKFITKELFKLHNLEEI